MPVYGAAATALQVSAGKIVSLVEGAIPAAIGQPLVITSLSPFKAEFGATVIQNLITVGKSGAVQYSTIEDGIAAALLGGAAPATPWLVVVYPGDYAENQLIVPSGVIVSSINGQRLSGVCVSPADPNDHLFVLTGGAIVGLNLEGVAGAGKALVYCNTLDTEIPDLESMVTNCRLTNAPIGIHITGTDVKTTLRNIRFYVDEAAKALGVGLKISAGGYGHAVEIYGSVEDEILALYPGVDPIGTLVEITGANSMLRVSGFHADVFGNTASQTVVLVDDSAHADVLDGHISNAQHAIRIGTLGTSDAMISGLSLHGNTKDFTIESATGKILASVGTDAYGKFDLTAGSHLSGTIQVEDDGETRVIGEVGYTFADGDVVNFPKFFSEHIGTGVSDGGEVTDAGGLKVDVAGGSGWIAITSENAATSVAWDPATDVVLTDDTTNYVYVDEYLGVKVALSPPAEAPLLAAVITKSGAVRYIHDIRFSYRDLPNALQTYLTVTRTFALDSGLLAAADADPTKFTIQPGVYYRGITRMSVAGKGVSDTFSSFYGTNGANETAGLTVLDTTNYDNAGALTGMTAAWYRADSVIITSDNRVGVIYGTSEHALQVDAEALGFGSIPTFLVTSGCSIANLIIQQGVGIVAVNDARPRPAASGLTAVAAAVVKWEDIINNPDAPDTTPHLLANGTRALAGNWSLGTYDLTNAGTINGVTIDNHKARHAPGGADALATAAPSSVTVGASNAEGSNASFARSDHLHALAAGVPVNVGTVNTTGNASTVAASNHVHAHGAHTDPLDHAEATALAAGFMPSAMWSTVNALPPVSVPSTRKVLGGTGLTQSGTGELSSDVTLNISATDGSIAVSADSIAVGILQSDAQHGARGGGTTHTAATAISNGFMTTTQFTKLAGISAGAINSTDHAALRQLTHFIGAPAEQWPSGVYREVTWGAVAPDTVTWWVDGTKTTKIFEVNYTRNAQNCATTIEWKMYDTDGISVLATITDAVTYSGIKETSRTRTIA